LHFLKSPLEFLHSKEDPKSIGSIVLGVNTLSGSANNQRADFSGKKEVVPAHLAFRSIGYRSINFDNDLPFDKRAGVVANLAGRVNNADLSGVYVCGWLKRGPTGIIGTF
jgi:adrenodoxin-NADP+ reductase